MIDKRADLILSPEMEKHVRPAYDANWGPSYLPIHSRVFEKTASQVYVPDRLIKAAASLSPREDGRYVHVNAVGANEAWGCFLPGAPVLRADGRYVPIEEVRRGDRVLSRSGQFRDVLTVWKHDHHQEGVRISVEGLVDNIETTPNHNFLGLPFDEIRCERDRHKRCIPETSGTQSICRRPQSFVCSLMPKTHTGRWVAAEALALKDFLLCALPEHDAPPLFTEDEARAIGLWVADGNFIGDTLEFSVADSELYLIEDIEKLAKAKVYEGHGACKSVRVNRPGLATEIKVLFSEYSHGKKIHGTFCRQPEEIVLAFLSGYFDGDGSQNLKDSTAYAHTVSKDLALGIQRLLWSVKIPATVCPASGGFHVNFSLDRGRRLAERCRKFADHTPKGRPSYRQFFIDGYVCLPIRKLERFRIDGPVYDLEVEEEHAYNVAQVVCHNSNKNGDLFWEWSLLKEPPPADVQALLNKRGFPIPSEYGVSTFETYAYPFVLHNNKDPVHSIGEKVICAAYNEKMRRGELIVFILKSKAPDLIDMIDRGEPIPWSMGCKVPFDVCSICKNIARNRNQYCEHLRTLLNVTLPDGRKVAAENWFPRFFDISRVITPAFAPAYSLRKVAGVNLPAADPTVVQRHEDYTIRSVDFVKVATAQEGMRKKRTIFKLGEISKEVPAEPGQDNLGKTLLKPKVQKILAKLVKEDDAASGCIPAAAVKAIRATTSPEEIFNGATASGILLKKPEVEMITDGDADRVPDRLDLDSVLPRLLSKFKEMVPSRSLFDPPFANRVVRVIRISGPRPGLSLDKGASAAYDKYLKVLGRLDVEDLVKAAERTLLTRDSNAVENAFAGVKTASDRFRPVTPFLVGLRLKKV